MNKPKFDKTCFIAPGAQVVGDVEIKKNASVWHNAVIRGDMAKITVGEGSNIQDNCTLHCDKDVPLNIGKNVTVGHNSVLHSCEVCDGSLIGMGAVVLTGAVINKGAVVAAGSLVTKNTAVPENTLFMGIPAKEKRALTKEETEKNIENAKEYQRLKNEYLGGEKFEILALKGLDAENLTKIYELADICEKHDPIVLKLSRSMLKSRSLEETNDFLCFKENRLVGYLGLYEIFKGCGEIEATGMVDPAFRNNGIFTKLYNAALKELKNRHAKTLLFITYGGCEEGKRLAEKFEFTADHTEFAMSCQKKNWKMSSKINLTFRRAVQSDLKEMVYLDMLGFELTREEAEGFYKDSLAEEYYIAEYDEKPVGHIQIVREEESFLVCGLVVSPIFRRKGFGREILDYSLDIVFSDGCDTAKLEVDSTNKIAQSLYLSAGFKVKDCYDYFKLEL